MLLIYDQFCVILCEGVPVSFTHWAWKRGLIVLSLNPKKDLYRGQSLAKNWKLASRYKCDRLHKKYLNICLCMLNCTPYFVSNKFQLQSFNRPKEYFLPFPFPSVWCWHKGNDDGDECGDRSWVGLICETASSSSELSASWGPLMPLLQMAR